MRIFHVGDPTHLHWCLLIWNRATRAADLWWVVVADLSDLKCSRVKRRLFFFFLFPKSLFFSPAYNMKQTENMRLAEFNYRLDEFHRLKEQVHSSVFLLIALYQMRSYLDRRKLKAPHTCKDILTWNIFIMHFLDYISSFENMTPRWSAARNPYAASCSSRLTATPPMPATTCKLLVRQ